jgi:hypothetical protein
MAVGLIDFLLLNPNAQCNLPLSQTCLFDQIPTHELTLMLNITLLETECH